MMMHYKRLLVVAITMVLPMLLKGNVSFHQDGQYLADHLQSMAAELLATINWERELNDLPRVGDGACKYVIGMLGVNLKF